MQSKKLLCVVFSLYFAAFAAGCGRVVTVSGTIIDGPVTETTVTITDSSEKVVGTAKSGSKAEYSIPVPVGASYPLRVSISGGTDQVTGEVPMEMESLIIDANQTTANVTPITFLIFQAVIVKAGGLGKVTSATVDAVRSDIISKFGFGIDAEDSNIDPITSSVSANNSVLFMKSAQALAETVRRAVSPGQAAMTLAFKVIGEDMADGSLDGKNNGAALFKEMPAGFDAATIVSTVTLQKALVGVEVINNSLKVTKSGGTQLSADDVKSRFSQSINRVEPTVTAAAALGKMEAVAVSDKQRSQVMTDIDNVAKFRDALEPGGNNATFVVLAGAVKGLEVGKPGSGKIDNSVMANAENAVNLVTGGIRDKTYTAGAIKAAFSAVVPSVVTSVSAGSSGNASESLPSTAEYTPLTDRPTVNFGGSVSGILALKKNKGGKNLTFKIDTNGKSGTATITDPTTGSFTYQSNRLIASHDDDCLYEIKISQILNDFTKGLDPAVKFYAINPYDVCGLIELALPLQYLDVSYEEFHSNIMKGSFKNRNSTFVFNIANSDVFTFIVSDGAIESQPIPVTVDIVNKILLYKLPTEGERITHIGQLFNGTLSSAVPGINGNLIYRIVSQGTKGTFALTDSRSGTYTYLPRMMTRGEDGFIFTVTDGSATSLPQYLGVTIANIPPSVKDVDYSGVKNTQMTFSAAKITSQFSDPNGDNISKIKVTSLPVNGSLTLKGVPVAKDQEIAAENLSNLVFIPKTDWNGSTNFTYNASDGTDYASSGANVNVTVYASNDPPTMVVPLADQTWNGKETKTFQIPGNTFTDVNGDALVYSATLADDLPLPSWISFDPSTRIFTGSTINGNVALKIKVTANDGKGGTAFGVFNLSLSGPKILSSTPQKIGLEFLVNDTQDGYAEEPTMASLGNSDSIVVWSNSSGVYGKRYNADGTQAGKQFKVNVSLSGHYRINGVTPDKDGLFIVMRNDNITKSYYYQKFDIKTNKFNINDIPLKVSVDTIRRFSLASVVGGGFVTVYESGTEKISDIKGQIYNSDGIPNGTEFLINSTSSGKQINPNVASLNNGGFVVTWESINNSTSYVVTRLYDSTGMPISGEQTVASIMGKFLVFPKVKELNNGNIDIVWNQKNNIYLRVYDGKGHAVSDKKRINPVSNEYQISPTLTYLGGSIGSIVTWLSVSGTATKIIGQNIDDNGTLIGDPFQINSQEKYCENVSLSRIGPERFMVSWGAGSDIHAQIFGFSTPHE